MNAQNIDTAEQAKLIRKALKRAFAAVKFSVTISRYAGGSSIQISWIDGPTAKMVEAVTDAYRGGGFDGSVDMAYSSSAWLMPDGSVAFASTEGTTGSMGSVPAAREWMPSPGAKLVRFAAKYVSCSRSFSAAFEAQLFARLARKGLAEAAGVVSMREAGSIVVAESGDYLSWVANREASKLVIARGAA